MLTLTHEQLLAMLDELHIVEAYRDEKEKRLMLVLRDEGVDARMTVTEFKNHQKDAIATLEEERQDVMENKFAEPMFGEVAMGPGKIMKVQIVKRDNQLTGAETTDKKKRLAAIDVHIRQHKKIIAGMNHLQVHFAELAPRLTSRSVFAPSTLMTNPQERTVWTKGIKSAVILCAGEFKKNQVSGRTQLDVCREFLSKYTLEVDEMYTPEKLSNNVTQLLMLDRLD